MEIELKIGSNLVLRGEADGYDAALDAAYEAAKYHGAIEVKVFERVGGGEREIIGIVRRELLEEEEER